MTSSRVLAVGSPPTFRQLVSRSLDGAADAVEWAPTVTAAEEAIVEGRAADVIVLSPGVKEADALGFAEFVGRRAPASAVILVRDHAPAALITAAMRAGTRDVVDLSVGNDELRDGVERALAWSSSVRAPVAVRSSEPARQGTMVAVFSSKGGSGKTFVATSLAMAVAKRWRVDTAVVDLDLDMGDVYSYYGLEPKLAVADLLALGDRNDRDSVIAAGTPVAEHLWAYGAPPDPAAEAPAGEAVGKLLRAIRDRFAFTVVDATAEYSDQALAAFDLADTICLVAALDVVGVRHLAKALETLGLIGVSRDRIRVVLNRADSQVGLSAEQVERIMHFSVDAKIPSSRLVPTGLNLGRPVYLDEPRSEIAAAIDALADLVAEPALGPGERRAEPPARRGLFRRRRAQAAPAQTAPVDEPHVPAAADRTELPETSPPVADAPIAPRRPRPADTRKRAAASPRTTPAHGGRRTAPARTKTTSTNGRARSARAAAKR
jgi:pilus assembly protein CpaE